MNFFFNFGAWFGSFYIMQADTANTGYGKQLNTVGTNLNKSSKIINMFTSGSVCSIIKNTVLLKPVLMLCYFHFIGEFLASIKSQSINYCYET